MTLAHRRLLVRAYKQVEPLVYSGWVLFLSLFLPESQREKRCRR